MHLLTNSLLITVTCAALSTNHHAVLDLGKCVVSLNEQFINAQVCRNKQGLEYEVNRLHLCKCTIVPAYSKVVKCKLDG